MRETPTERSGCRPVVMGGAGGASIIILPREGEAKSKNIRGDVSGAHLSPLPIYPHHCARPHASTLHVIPVASSVPPRSSRVNGRGDKRQ
jgi:hypothetical protein